MVTLPTTAEEHLEALCSLLGLSVLNDVRRHDKSAHAVRLRRRIAAELRVAGYSYPEIGRAMGRDHSTIISLLKGVEVDAHPRRAREFAKADVFCSCCKQRGVA